LTLSLAIGFGASLLGLWLGRARAHKRRRMMLAGNYS
jgi:hypothetical protein